ncbi:hypothetical protein [Wenzhouxiangella sp. EGI_FJ10305]|uniref:hypothetical protein n=1 Tax=Wenzhouxiangella sp. EGI_FJ10305 TaxID=3243768 RepID=UPI0035D67B15
MPSPEQILTGLQAISNDWRGLATIWHVFAGTMLLGIVFGLRLSRRVMASALTLPFISVSVLAWLQPNPFNGGIFALAAVVLLVIAARLPRGVIGVASGPPLFAGVLMIAFAWIYPHFLDDATLLDYLVSAPLGLVPCPTISMVIGISLLLGGFGSRSWCWTLAILGLFYGVFGAVRLGVALGWLLLVGALALGATGYFRCRPDRAGVTGEA